MKTKHLAAAAGGVSMAVAAVFALTPKEPATRAPVAASFQPPEYPELPQIDATPTMDVAASRLESWPDMKPPVVPALATVDDPLPAIDPPLKTWSREIESGETLDAVLAEAGLDAADRAEIALALGAEFDLRRLRPGHSIALTRTPDGRPLRITLAVDDGVRVEAVFGQSLATRVVTPEPDTVTIAGKTIIESSIAAALDDANLPARFAVDLAQMLSGTVDFRRELSGGETLRLLWREKRLDDQRIGQPDLAFAALEMGETLYEVVWPDDSSGRATIYVDGELLRVFAQPVEGARLSSVFGRRKHPIYGNVRMHTGVDFAAARGTPVHATAPGRISYVGWRGGYGRVVEITHGSDTVTRYTHLSSVTDDLSTGQRIKAGEVIGRVGSSGTATGPNMHYEVLVDGRPTDPLADDRLAEITGDKSADTAAQERLTVARAQLEEHLSERVTDRL
ncbi:M23 family metallopeptidase [Ruegeria sp. Alg231-54]|uniref:peptidoglycan DD-metalloendopeptidase family protein n=1 Tax=Ruegeria sp. Alg231-54 TaxID=1922221 RepID=UPI00190220B8